jgi:predicted dehydrogenase
MSRPRLRVALIGYQFMGRAHANAWRQAGRFFELPAEIELAILCGRSRGAVAAAAPKLGFAEAATDWEEVVERADVDVVDVCTPGDSHAAIAIAAARAGKAVLCEKPLANDVADAERMRDAALAAGIVHMVCHNYRRAPAVALAKRIVEEGRLGRIHHWRGTYLQDWIVDPAFPRVWRLEKARAGSGALGDIGSHSIDLARLLVGEISEVAGLLETFVRERPLPEGGGMGPVDVDDAALALVRFEGGAIGTIEGTRFAPGRKNQNRFEVNGSRGSLAFDLERMNELELYEEKGADSGFRTILATDPSHPYVAAWWPPGHMLGYEHTFVHTVADFVTAVAERRDGGAPASGKGLAPDFEDGVRNQRVLAAIERSAASRRWERV